MTKTNKKNYCLSDMENGDFGEAMTLYEARIEQSRELKKDRIVYITKLDDENWCDDTPRQTISPKGTYILLGHHYSHGHDWEPGCPATRIPRRVELSDEVILEWWNSCCCGLKEEIEAVIANLRDC